MKFCGTGKPVPFFVSRIHARTARRYHCVDLREVLNESRSEIYLMKLVKIDKNCEKIMLYQQLN